MLHLILAGAADYRSDPGAEFRRLQFAEKLGLSAKSIRQALKR